MSVRIINARGIPGTLAGLGRTIRQRRPVFLTCWHVLFAAGAARLDPVWQVSAPSGQRHQPLGCALHGKRGIVRYRGEDYFVDCAIGALDASVGLGLPPLPGGPVAPMCGDRVWKSGAASGITTGIVVDAGYAAASDHGRVRVHAPGQLLIRSSDPRQPFAQEGDSGALVWNQDDAPVGLLWGTTVAAEGIACPIGPVLQALSIELCGRCA